MEALKIRQNKLLPDDPAIAESLTSLALLKKDQGHPAKAEPLLQRALVMQERKMPADHPAIARTLSNLAGRSHERGDWHAALAYARRASTIIIQRHMRASTAEDIGTMESTARPSSAKPILIPLACARGLAIGRTRADWASGTDRRGVYHRTVVRQDLG